VTAGESTQTPAPPLRTEPRRAYLGLGSNLGDRAAHLQGAVDGLAATEGVAVTAVSRVFESEPVGGPPQPEFLNAVVEVETDLDARALLGVAQRLEARAGRVRLERWGPRTLDVDVLLVGDEVRSEDDLVVPHPRMAHRAFVLAPLGDLDPNLVVAPAAGWQGVRLSGVELRIPETQ